MKALFIALILAATAATAAADTITGITYQPYGSDIQYTVYLDETGQYYIIYCGSVTYLDKKTVNFIKSL